MKHNFLGQILIAIVLAGLAVFLLNPLHLFMPSMIVMVVSACILVAFAAFTGFIMREEMGDEREVFHRMYAGRTAFLVGIGALMAGIVVQAFSHSVDSWLVGVLVLMIVTKIAVRIYTDRNL